MSPRSPQRRYSRRWGRRTEDEIADAQLLGQPLAALRSARGLSKGIVAKRGRVSRQTVYNAEVGKHHPRHAALMKILRGMGCSEAELFAAQESIRARSEYILPEAAPAGILPEDALLAAVELAEQASRTLARCVAMIKLALSGRPGGPRS